jgi:hypothetical protein
MSSGEYGGFKPPEPVWDIIAEQERREHDERNVFVDGVIEEGIAAVAEKFDITNEHAQVLYYSRVIAQLEAQAQKADDNSGEEYAAEGTDLDDAIGDPLGLNELWSHHPSSSQSWEVANPTQEESRRRIREILELMPDDGDRVSEVTDLARSWDSSEEIAEILGDDWGWEANGMVSENLEIGEDEENETNSDTREGSGWGLR